MEGRTEHIRKTYKVGMFVEGSMCLRDDAKQRGIPCMWAERVEGLGYGMGVLARCSVCLVSAFTVLSDSSFPLQETLLFVCGCLWLAARMPCSSAMLHYSWLHFYMLCRFLEMS